MAMSVSVTLSVRVLAVRVVVLEVQRLGVECGPRALVILLVMRVVVFVRVVGFVRGLDHDNHGSVLAFATYKPRQLSPDRAMPLTRLSLSSSRTTSTSST